MTRFRKPWEDGAQAYYEADDVDAALAGIVRHRRPLTVLIRHETRSLDGVPCDACGLDLAGPYDGGRDRYAMMDVDPTTRRYSLRHYRCAWTSALAELAQIRDAS